MDLAREIDALGQATTPLELAGHLPDVAGERGRPPKRVHGRALAVRQLEGLAVAVGEDHTEPAPRRRDRRAGELGDSGQVAVAGRDVGGQVGGLHHPVFREGPSRDRGLLQAAVGVGDELAEKAVAAGG